MRSALVLSLLPFLALAAQEGQLPGSVELFVSGQRVIDAAKVSRVAVGDPKVCTVKRVGDKQLILRGVGQGETTVRLWDTNGERSDIKVRVAAAPVKAVKDEELTLRMGAEHTLAIEGITRIAVGDSEILDIRMEPNDQLRLIAGKQVAATTLIIWTGDTRRSIVVHVVK